MQKLMRFSGLALAAALLVSGCANPDSSNTKTDSANATATPSGTGLEATGGDAAEGGGFSDGQEEQPRVDANKATAEEITKALETMKVAEPAKWVPIVEANRPYVATDPIRQDLRAKLAEAGADEDLQDRIVSVLDVKS